MNSKHVFKSIYFILAVLLVFQILSSPGVAADNALNDYDSQRLDELLKEIADYDYGDSRESLTEVKNLVKAYYESPQALQDIEKKMIDFLETDASFASKQFVCQRISLIGTEQSVPVLADMLADPPTADMARYALERIPGQKVDQALQDMLGETTGLVKIGIINTMGVRKDPRAVSVLEKQVYSDNEIVAKAAAAALGEIGNQHATTALQDAMNKTSGELHNVVLDAYLKCADQYLADNQSEKAFNIYQTLYAPSQPDAIQAAAIRGMVFSDMQKSEQHIIAGMKNSNSYIKSVAIGLIKDLPKPVNLQSFAEEFDQLEAKHKVQLLTAFADVGDRSVQSTVKSAVQDENTNVRIAALNALKVLGDANSVMTLARTAADKRDEEREAARESLYRLSAPNVNQTIIKNISTAEPGVKIELINSLGERDATEATDELLKISRDADGKVRVASLKVLGQIAGPKYLSDAIGILEKAQTDTEREAAVQMVTDIAQKTPEKDQQADKVMARLDSVTDPEVKSSLLRVLGKVGDPDALSVLRDALDDGSEEIKTAAIRALSDWPTTTPMDDLLNVAQTADDEIQQVLALRGYIDFIKADQKLSDNDKVQRYQKAMQLAQNTREKQMALSGLAELNSLKALQTATGYLDNVTLKQEAEMAVFQIARSIRRDHPAEAKSALKQVLAQTDNAGLKEDAKRILDAID